MIRWLLAILALLQVAWQGYYTDFGTPVRWTTPEIVVDMDANGTQDVEGDAEFEAVAQAMATWNSVVCPHPMFVEGQRVSNVKPGLDTGKNLIIWVNDPKEWSAPQMDHIIALTTLYYDSRSGVAAKFDMEMADFAYKFTVTDVLSEVSTDVQNAVTHELGHVLGLDHSKDPEATMFPTAMEGDLSKRDLAEDDIEGVCTLYQSWPHSNSDSGSPSEGLPVTEGGGRGGCTLGAPASNALGFIVTLFFILLLCKRRQGGDFTVMY